MRFPDRRSAGGLLGKSLAELHPDHALVYALPRGGVPVGYEVARHLDCPLDVLVVRKIGVPYQPELAMGAIGEDGVVLRNDEVVALAGVDEAAFDAVVRAERRELARRVALYRGESGPLSPAGHTAILVDDGIATGSTALAGVAVLREMGAEQVWVAAPVAPPDTAEVLGRVAERVEILRRPQAFGAVGAWYRDFAQTRDEEVRDLLAESGLR